MDPSDPVTERRPSPDAASAAEPSGGFSRPRDQKETPPLPGPIPNSGGSLIQPHILQYIPHDPSPTSPPFGGMSLASTSPTLGGAKTVLARFQAGRSSPSSAKRTR